MAEKIATREAYGKALAALADKYPDLVCFDADLAGATMTKFFKAACPERFFDMGIAEADMVGVAAGMSLCGFKPFVNTFAMFAAGRAWEQVRNSVAYPHLNVKVVGSHGVNDEFGRSGKAPLVLDAYGINADGIAAKAKQAIAMKK